MTSGKQLERKKRQFKRGPKGLNGHHERTPTKLFGRNEKAPLGWKAKQSFNFSTVGLGRLELPTSRLSDMSRALVGARGRWKSGDLADSALVGARQRSPALLQVLLQLSHRRRNPYVDIKLIA